MVEISDKKTNERTIVYLRDVLSVFRVKNSRERFKQNPLFWGSTTNYVRRVRLGVQEVDTPPLFLQHQQQCQHQNCFAQAHVVGQARAQSET